VLHLWYGAQCEHCDECVDVEPECGDVLRATPEHVELVPKPCACGGCVDTQVHEHVELECNILCNVAGGKI